MGLILSLGWVCASIAQEQDAANIDSPLNEKKQSVEENHEEKSKEHEPSKPALYETIVRSKRPIARDRTQDDLKVEGKTLRESPRASTLEALSQESSGVYVTGRGALHGVSNGATGGVYIRGLGGSPNSQVLVVEDGVPDYMGIFGHPIPDAYVPFLIDDALVIKGGDSVLYGTNALGGVVVLRNRWRESDGFEFFNDAAFGSYSTLQETTSTLYRTGKLDLAAALHGLTTKGHRTGAGGEEVVGHLATRYRFTPNLSLTLRNKVVHLKGADPGPVTHPNIDHWFDVWRNNTSTRLEWQRNSVHLTGTPFFNLGVHRLYDGFFSHDYVAGGIVEADFKLHSSTQVLLGFSSQHVDGRVENRIDGEQTPVEALTNLSVYNQITLQPLKPLSIVAGARFHHSFTYGSEILYKGGIRWDIYRGLYAHTRIARNFRQPTIRELYLPYPVANPDLRPEYSLNSDFSLGFKSQHVEVSGTGYRTQADDMIRYFGSWPSAEVVNIDHIVIWGAEGRIALRNLGPVSMSVSRDWQDVGRYTRQNPSSKLNFTLEVNKELGPHFMSASLTGEWVQGLYMSNYSRDPIDDVFSMDLAFRYRYVSRERGFSLEPYLFLRNFLDRRYAYVEGYPMPGFNVLMGLRVGIL